MTVRVALLAGVSRDRASVEIRRLVALGIVSQREVAGASLVKLERMNSAALALLALADARSTAISRLSELAKSIEPLPASLALFGSLDRGTDDGESDLDVFAVRPDDVEPDDPSWLDSFGNWQDLARAVVGNPINVSGRCRGARALIRNCFTQALYILTYVLLSYVCK
jgi:predicted nucleotidyltransferase